jgi:putative DNA primase/helicase
MSASAAVIDRLVSLGINLKRHTYGNHRTACPWCAKGKKDTALAVKIDQDGATWVCHRCGNPGAANEDFDKPLRGTHPAAALLAKVAKGPAGKLVEHYAPAATDPERHETLSRWGRTLWENSQPIEPGSIASRYLIGRGCALPPADGHLRWHPALSDLVSSYTGPCLVGLVTRIEDGEPLNLHRTWLKADGTGKAPIDIPRRMLKGHTSHDAVIRLWPDDEVTMGLVIGEGIETCLAAARAGLTPVWSTISAGNMAGFPVLPGIEGLTILVDHDKPNPHTGKRAGTEAARTLVRRYVAAGFDPERDMEIVFPGKEGLDAADLIEGAA